MHKILLGVTGSVAAYKAAMLIRAMQSHQCAVQTIATNAALQFVGAATFRALSGKPVAVDDFHAPLSDNGMDHITLARDADCLVVAPASADFLGKAANGYADNLLLSAFLAADCPKFVAPAMNQQMWHANATQRNIQTLAQDGVRILAPESGEQACGEQGLGRMMNPDIIAKTLADFLLSRHQLRGRRVVVNTGATMEFIDDMRVISNISSGKMGFCIAEAAANIGAEVQIIAANTSASPPNLPIRRVRTNEEMHRALSEECGRADIFIAAAAIADYAPKKPFSGKIPRKNGGINLDLVASDDILASIAKDFPNLFIVGFDAQGVNSGGVKKRGGTNISVTSARRKMRRKNADMIVANAVQDAGGESSQLTLVTASEAIALARQSKQMAAAQLMREVAARMVSRETLMEKQTS